MKKQGLQTWLYSTIGVVAMLVVVVGINLIGSRAKVRIDLTQEHAYTLSEGTRAILSKLDTPVQVRLYCTRSENAMPLPYKAYADRIEDLLKEFRQISKGQIEIQKLDPTPLSDAEDSARVDGLEPQSINAVDRFYLGVSVTMLEHKETLPFLAPEGEQTLEYELARAISRVAKPEKPIVGVMSPLPVNGFSNPMMQRQGRQGLPEWALMSELRRDFTVRTVEMTAEKIPDEVKVLLVIHPKEISDVAQYAIDQFVLRGGKLIAFLDPLAVWDPAMQGGQMGASSQSSLDKLLKAWGLTFDPTKIVADTTYLFEQRGQRTPVVLDVSGTAIDKTDVLTTGMERFFLPFAGAFTGTPAEGLKQTVLIKSSTNSQLVDPMLSQLGPEQIIKTLEVSGVEYPLAVRLSGKFKTAFPGGKPQPAPNPDETKPEEKKPEPPAGPGLAESKQATDVILIGDSDCLQDQATLQMMQTGDGMIVPRYGNFALAQGAVDQMAGDENLIGVRSRGSRERPFTVVKKLRADAEAAYQSKIQELDARKGEIVTKRNQLMASNPQERGKRVVLPPEIQKEINDYLIKEQETEREKKALLRKMNTDIDSLKTRTTWMNIFIMPAVVAVIGLVFAVLRRRAHAAR